MKFDKNCPMSSFELVFGLALYMFDYATDMLNGCNMLYGVAKAHLGGDDDDVDFDDILDGSGDDGEHVFHNITLTCGEKKDVIWGTMTILFCFVPGILTGLLQCMRILSGDAPVCQDKSCSERCTCCHNICTRLLCGFLVFVGYSLFFPIIAMANFIRVCWGESWNRNSWSIVGKQKTKAEFVLFEAIFESAPQLVLQLYIIMIVGHLREFQGLAIATSFSSICINELQVLYRIQDDTPSLKEKLVCFLKNAPLTMCSGIFKFCTVILMFVLYRYWSCVPLGLIVLIIVCLHLCGEELDHSFPVKIYFALLFALRCLLILPARIKNMLINSFSDDDTPFAHARYTIVIFILYMLLDIISMILVTVAPDLMPHWQSHSNTSAVLDCTSSLSLNTNLQRLHILGGVAVGSGVLHIVLYFVYRRHKLGVFSEGDHLNTGQVLQPL